MERVAEAVAAVDEVTGTDPGPAATSDPTAAAEADAAAGDDGSSSMYTADWADLPVSATAAGATVTLPADTAPGAYELVLVEGTDPLAPSSVVVLSLDVAAAPAVTSAAPASAAPAAPALNVGLRSETGWEEERPASPLVAVGAAALVVAALGTVAVLRPRRRDGLDATGGSPLR